MSGSPKQKLPRCHHCGREVHETVHTRSDYRVDFYELVTGKVEEVTRVAADDSEPFTYLKLVEPWRIVTCVDCNAKPGMASERDRLFRPEIGDERGAEE